MAGVVRIQLRPRGNTVRCVWCHGGLPAVDVWRCGACSALLHDGCRQELARCPTIGCPSWSPRRRPMTTTVPLPAPVAAPEQKGCLLLLLEALGALLCLLLG